MRTVCYYCLLIILFDLNHALIFHGCRFFEKFYRSHSAIFQLDRNQTSLTVRPLYALENQSLPPANETLAMGIIYRQGGTYLVPVPLLLQCPHSERLYAPTECEFTIADARVRNNEICLARQRPISALVLARSVDSNSRIHTDVDGPSSVSRRSLLTLATLAWRLLQAIDHRAPALSFTFASDALRLRHSSTSHRIRANHSFAMPPFVPSFPTVRMLAGIEHVPMPIARPCHRTDRSSVRRYRTRFQLFAQSRAMPTTLPYGSARPTLSMSIGYRTCRDPWLLPL